MSRETLLRELDVYKASSTREAAMVTELTAFIRKHDDCFERLLSVGHLTASAWVLDEDLTHALLTHHRKLERWLQLGGHADGDDDLRRVALREAREESGLATIRFADSAIYDVDIHTIPARQAEPEHRHYDVRFVFFADRHLPTTANAESHELAWVPVAELDVDGIDESVRRLARKTALVQRTQST